MCPGPALPAAAAPVVMKPSMHSKLAQLAKRMTEIDALLSREDAARDMDRFRALGQEDRKSVV